MISILLINVYGRATLKNIGAKRSVKNFDVNVAGTATNPDCISTSNINCNLAQNSNKHNYLVEIKSYAVTPIPNLPDHSLE